jgi:GTPase SAR1 family protein
MLLLGNSGVGKTTFIRRLSDYPFSPAYQPTGFYAMSAISPVLDVIEMPGSELYRTFPSDAFRGVDRVVVMLSLDDAETLYTYSRWIQKVQHLDKPVLLLVNKSDLDAEPQTTIFTLMSLRAESNPWRFVSSRTDSKDHLLYTLLR